MIQLLIMETDERTNGRTNERTKIEKPLHGRPPLGPAKKQKVHYLIPCTLLILDCACVQSCARPRILSKIAAIWYVLVIC